IVAWHCATTPAAAVLACCAFFVNAVRFALLMNRRGCGPAGTGGAAIAVDAEVALSARMNVRIPRRRIRTPGRAPKLGIVAQRTGARASERSWTHFSRMSATPERRCCVQRERSQSFVTIVTGLNGLPFAVGAVVTRAR